MKSRLSMNAITLLELILAITLLSVIVLGFLSLDIYSHFQVIAADRRAKLQNEAAYILEHMTKEINRAIGDVLQTTLIVGSGGGVSAVMAVIDKSVIDGSSNGIRDPLDTFIAYRFGTDNYQLWYCPRCVAGVGPCDACDPPWGTAENILSKKIADFTPSYTSINNYLRVDLAARWMPAQNKSVDNPEVNMSTRIKMPSVSTN